MEVTRLKLLTLVLMAMVSFFLVVAQVSLKKSLVIFSEGVNITSILSYMISYKFLESIFFVFLAFIIWVYVISYEDLHLAYPLMSISYLFMYAYSYYFLDEQFQILSFTGVILIILGVFMMFLDVK
jgi:drug/metabolite transporter (DMT)-like permease